MQRTENISVHRRCISFLWSVLFFCLCLFPATSFAQEEEYEEVIVSVGIQDAGLTEMPAVVKGQSVYLPIVDLFDYLRIKNTPSPGLDSISGFFISEQAKYFIDVNRGVVIFSNKNYQIKPEDIIKTETGFYLHIKYLGQIFGLESKFNFRALLVNISTTVELPVVREARLGSIRNNINRLKGDIPVDTFLPRSKEAFRAGVLDWSVTGTEQVIVAGKPLNNLRFTGGFGAMIAGGEANISINHVTGQKFDRRRQYYAWRYVNNDAKFVKQTILGKLPINAISSIFAPVVGAQITNTSTKNRRAFGSYTLSDITEPGWIVELYINGNIIDYTKADPSGFFSFEVPVIYGSSIVKLKFYGPYGEERTKEQNINVPFNFLPPGQVEYNVSGGFLENDSTGIFSRGSMNYGLNKHITVGGGVEYFTSVRNPVLPFLNMSSRIGPNIMFGGDYVHDVRGKMLLTYRRPSNLQFDIQYANYREGQVAVNTPALEERRVVVTVPIKGKGYSFFNSFSATQNLLKTTEYTNAEWAISGRILGINTSISNYGIFIKNAKPLLYSNIGIAFPIRRVLLFTSQVQYDYTNGAFISSRGVLEKRISKFGNVLVSYERNFKSNLDIIGLQMRYDLPWTQLSSTSYRNNSAYTLTQTLRGSILFDDNSNHMSAILSTSLGRGAIELAPFLDLNCNEKRDPGEPKVSGLKFRISSGYPMPESKDTTISVRELEAYSRCVIELNRFSFDNISWQIRKKTIAVTVQPNIFSRIDVPVAVVAEVNGMVFLTKNGDTKGQGQIIVNIYKDGQFVAKTMTEADGYFSYIGLSPGAYTISIDQIQMGKVKMTSSPALNFNVIENIDGDVVQGLEFNLQSTK